MYGSISSGNKTGCIGDGMTKAYVKRRRNQDIRPRSYDYEPWEKKKKKGEQQTTIEEYEKTKI